METQTKNSKVCMACACPCKKHKEHTHGAGMEHKHKIEKGVKTCSTCRMDDKDCGCNQ